MLITQQMPKGHLEEEPAEYEQPVFQERRPTEYFNLLLAPTLPWAVCLAGYELRGEELTRRRDASSIRKLRCKCDYAEKDNPTTSTPRGASKNETTEAKVVATRKNGESEAPVLAATAQCVEETGDDSNEWHRNRVAVLRLLRRRTLIDDRDHRDPRYPDLGGRSRPHLVRS